MLGALALAASLPLAACNIDNLLEVTDPDIINPGDVSSASGAEAMRIGALSRFVGTTTGSSGGTFYETAFIWSGMLADEWVTGDTFAQRLQVDQRAIAANNSGVTDTERNMHRARLSAEQAVRALRQFSPNAPRWQAAELFFVQSFIETMFGEYFCSGVAISSVVDGVEQFGTQLTTAQMYTRALAHADSAIALASGTAAADVRVRNAATVLKARILLNQERFAEAAATVQSVPTAFAYNHQHSQTTRDNVVWSVNNSTRRYTVANNEGGNGINFATANDPRLPVCRGGSQQCRDAGVTQTAPFNTLTPSPLFVQLKWRERSNDVALVNGIEARLIEAEALLAKGASDAYLPILNQLRTTVTGLAPLTDPGTPQGRVDQLFRERAFWMFGTGRRLGDLRRLVRQYGRDQATVFPVGNFAEGGQYGSDVNFPVTQPEENNPNVQMGQTCIDRRA
jgi:starch-binding outer membrane protein, SusD/RagB family